MAEETAEQKQARFDKALAEKLERNRKAAEEAAEQPKQPGRQAAARTRHHTAPRHGDQGRKTGKREKK